MRRISLFAVLLVLGGFAACGNKAEDSTVATPPSDYGTTAPSASAGASPKVNNHGTKTFTKSAFALEVEQDNDGSDFYFNPTFVQAPGDATATVNLHNEGNVQHNFSIDSLKIDVDLAPDEKKTVTVKLGTDRLEFYCKFHRPLGMSGAFLVH